MNKHTMSDLYQMQSLPLSIKIRMTQYRIREWVDYYGADSVYIAFSGGKDSSVLLHVAREMYPKISAVYVDTGLEYPEVREFVKRQDNVEIIRPKMNFRQVIIKYGYPMIGKEVAGCVYGARRYMEKLLEREKSAEHGGKVPYALTLQKAKKLLSGMFSFFNKRYLHQFQNVKAHRLYIW